MAQIVYNGIPLPDCNITQFEQTAMGDELGDTDWFVTKFDVQAQCVVTAAFLPIMAPDLAIGTPAQNAADVMTAIRTRLLRRRRPLSVKFNDIELIPQPQLNGPSGTEIPGYVDAQNGPRPISCRIIQLTNTTFIMAFHVIAHYWENPVLTPGTPLNVGNNPGNVVLYNRWSETVSMDNCQYSRRTRQGKFVIRSDNVEGATADEIRTQMSVTGVPKGFLRENSTYTISPDGLAIQYTITDKEVFKMPPKPAFEADGEYGETAAFAGPIRVGRVHVRLRGDKSPPNQFSSQNDTQTELIVAAVRVASQKIKQRTDLNANQKNTIITNAHLSIGLYDNWVDFTMECQFQLPIIRGQQFNGLVGFMQISTKTPLSDGETYTPDYSTRGTAALFLQAAAYYDPSLTNDDLDEAEGQLDGLEVGEAGVMRE